MEKKGLKIDKRKKDFVFECPFCKSKPNSATILVNDKSKLNCFKCKPKKQIGRYYNLIDVVRQIEKDKSELNDDDILQYIKEELDLNVTTDKEVKDIEKYLQAYQENGWDLAPVVGEKECYEKEWQKKTHTDIEEWRRWIFEDKINIAVKTGKVSGVSVVDLDTKGDVIPEEIESMMGETLVQVTANGWHLFYKYDENLPTTNRIDYDKTDIDIKNDGGYIVIYPSVTDNFERYFVDNKIATIPDKLKKFLLKRTNSIKIKEIDKEQYEIEKETYRKKLIGEGEGRNELFVRLGGMYRKFLPIDKTKQALRVLDKIICQPPLNRELDKTVFKSIEKYTQSDESRLEHQILEYLKEVERATQAEIELSLSGRFAAGKEKTDIKKALLNLEKDNKIKRWGKQYHIIKQMEWKDTFLGSCVPVDFKVPYFDDYCYFNKGDLSILGSKNKYGKSCLSMNIVQRFVKQGIKPYYIYSESGGRFEKYAKALKLKEGDFNRVFCSDPQDVILEPNAVTIYDWLMPKDFSQTDKIFSKLIEQLEKTKGFMICFVQLKHDESFFARNMIGQFPTILSRYLYSDDKGLETKFVLDDVRDPKFSGKKSYEIPCQYIPETKEVKTAKELME